MRLPVRSASKSRHGWNEALDSPSNSRAGALAATAREHRPKGVMPENSVLANPPGKSWPAEGRRSGKDRLPEQAWMAG